MVFWVLAVRDKSSSSDIRKPTKHSQLRHVFLQLDINNLTGYQPQTRLLWYMIKGDKAKPLHNSVSAQTKSKVDAESLYQNTTHKISNTPLLVQNAWLLLLCQLRLYLHSCLPTLSIRFIEIPTHRSPLLYDSMQSQVNPCFPRSSPNHQIKDKIL